VCAFNFHTAVGYTVSQLDVALHPRPLRAFCHESKMIKPHCVDVVRWGDFFQSTRGMTPRVRVITPAIAPCTPCGDCFVPDSSRNIITKNNPQFDGLAFSCDLL
jgi:hypothetical protein